VFDKPANTPVQFLHTYDHQVSLYIKREDLIHPQVSGNKWRKLKYNFREAEKQGHAQILTFGGAFSNHIHATAAAGNLYGMQTIGMIRGEIIEPLNPTLQQAKNWGMKLIAVSRDHYVHKTDPKYLRELQRQFGPLYLIPEGGSNLLAVKGVSEMTNIPEHFDYWCVSCGTGATLAGIVSGLSPVQTVLGFPALKGGDFLREPIAQLLESGTSEQEIRDQGERTRESGTKEQGVRGQGGKEQDSKGQLAQWDLITDYHFGGYAKVNDELLNFIREFKSIHGIQLDPIYTGKLLYGITELIKSGYFAPNTSILAVHSGGLQGIAGIEKKYGIKLK